MKHSLRPKKFLLVFFSIFFITLHFASAALTNICPGEPKTINWSSSNIAGTCTPSWSPFDSGCNFSPDKNENSSSNITPGKSCTITLTCDGVTDTDTLTVNANQSRCCGNWSLSTKPTWNGATCIATPVIGTFTNNGPINYNTKPTLTWSGVTGATSCSINGGVGTASPVAGGNKQPPSNLTVDTTYTITCTNGTASVTKSTTVDVKTTAPVVTATVSTTRGGSTGSAFYGETTGKINWSATNAPTACSVYVGGVLKLNAAAYPGTATYTLPAITANTSAYVTCSNGQPGTSNTVNFTIPPLPTGLSASCDAPGTALTLNWTLPVTYTKAYLRGYKTPPSSIDWNSACSPMKYAPNGLCVLVTGTSYSTTSTAGSQYYWYMHTAKSDDNWSNSVAGGTFTCTKGTISATAACTIASGASTCTVPFTWSVTSPKSAVSSALKNITRALTYSTAPSGTSVSYAVTNGANTIQITDNGVSLASVVVTGSCIAGSVWDVDHCESTVQPTGNLSASPTSCSITTGASTCNTTLTWNTANPISTSAVTRDGTGGNLYTGNNNAGQVTAVPYDADGTVIYRLYNNAIELDTASVDITCAAGATNWDTIGTECADPQVGPVTLEDDYYSNPADLKFTCTGSDHYTIIRDVPIPETIIVNNAPYSGPVSFPVTVSGNYKVICSHGSVDSAPSVIYYHNSPPASFISVDAYPKTIAANERSAIKWSIAFPPLPGDGTCTLTAYPVCTNGACTSSQNLAAAAINTIINTGVTDDDDLEGPGRPIVDAVRMIAPGHMDTDHKALGKKTFKFTNTTDFTVDCGSGNKATSRVRVTKSNEE